MAGLKIDLRYFLASYDQTKTATESVFNDLRPLLEAALGKVATQEELSRFVDQVWSITEGSTSNLFFETLRIPQKEWLEIVFAWKALLFYRLDGRKAEASLVRMTEAMKAIKIHSSHGMSSFKVLHNLERRIARNLFKLKHRACTYVDNTASALINTVSSQFDAKTFRKTLLELSPKIVAVGTDFTVFDQIVSYYNYLYKHLYN